MEGLPEGVRAHGLKIPAGRSCGIMLVWARENSRGAMARAMFTGHATIDGAAVSRPCRMASMSFPIPDAWNEIPSPRLMADVPVSVSGFDFAPITIAAASKEVLTVVAGQKLTIPLTHTRRS